MISVIAIFVIFTKTCFKKSRQQKYPTVSRNNMKARLLITFLLYFNFCFSQKVEYKISFSGKQQSVTLIKNNKKYSGKITTYFFKEKSEKKIIDYKKIDKFTAKYIFEELSNKGFENIENCSENKECSNTTYLDGDYTVLSVKINNIENKRIYPEIYPESEVKNLESTEVRREVQKLITIVDLGLNLKEYFRLLLNKHGNGTCYWKGIYQTCIKYAH